MHILLTILSFTFMMSLSYGKECDVKPTAKGGLAVFQGKKILSSPQLTIPELAYEDFEDLIRSGECSDFKPKPCEITPFGSEGLFVSRNGARVSDAWDNMPEFAYHSLVRLVDYGYCSIPKPRDCKIIVLKDKKYAVYSGGKRISQLWDYSVHVKISLKRFREYGYCR
jgi:hypothetical protein